MGRGWIFAGSLNWKSPQPAVTSSFKEILPKSSLREGLLIITAACSHLIIQGDTSKKRYFRSPTSVLYGNFSLPLTNLVLFQSFQLKLKYSSPFGRLFEILSANHWRSLKMQLDRNFKSWIPVEIWSANHWGSCKYNLIETLNLKFHLKLKYSSPFGRLFENKSWKKL